MFPPGWTSACPAQVGGRVVIPCFRTRENPWAPSFKFLSNIVATSGGGTEAKRKPSGDFAGLSALKEQLERPGQGSSGSRGFAGLSELQEQLTVEKRATRVPLTLERKKATNESSLAEKGQEPVALMVSNLPKDLTRAEYESFMQQIPEVSSCTFLTHNSGRCRGYGFCEIRPGADVATVLGFISSQTLGGRTLKASIATRKKAPEEDSEQEDVQPKSVRTKPELGFISSQTLGGRALKTCIATGKKASEEDSEQEDLQPKSERKKPELGFISTQTLGGKALKASIATCKKASEEDAGQKDVQPKSVRKKPQAGTGVSTEEKARPRYLVTEAKPTAESLNATVQLRGEGRARPDAQQELNTVRSSDGNGYGTNSRDSTRLHSEGGSESRESQQHSDQVRTERIKSFLAGLERMAAAGRARQRRAKRAATRSTSSESDSEDDVETSNEPQFIEFKSDWAERIQSLEVPAGYLSWQGFEQNHGVLVVGCGTAGGLDYWMVKNSWGESWVTQATAVWHVTDPRGLCGIANAPSYPTKST